MPTKYKNNITVATLYKFVEINDLLSLRSEIQALCKENNAKGTILLAKEGINGTISAKNKEIRSILKKLKSDKRFKKLEVKFSETNKMPFNRMKVRIKREIVTIGDDSINPNIISGDYVKPENWNELISDPEVIVIDTRNTYETKIGKFKNAIDPKTNSFREFPDWVKNFKKAIKNKDTKIAMYCTGGIRCEKSTSLMKKEGFNNVFHLEGGILKYLEKMSDDETLWDGECFVFDDRVALDDQLEVGSYQMCYACRMPLKKTDLKDDKYKKGVSCHYCYNKTSEQRKERFLSRQKQIEIAKSRGTEHFGPQIKK